MVPVIPEGSARPYTRWLTALLALFVVRVVAQPLALVTGPGILPAFDAWHSGVVPYGVLLAAQIAIVAALCRVVWRLSRGRVAPDRRRGRILLACGSVYFAFMTFRLVMGATLLSGQAWFARPLPTAFHLVLAGFMLVYGHLHYRHGAPP